MVARRFHVEIELRSERYIGMARGKKTGVAADRGDFKNSSVGPSLRRVLPAYLRLGSKAHPLIHEA